MRVNEKKYSPQVVSHVGKFHAELLIHMADSISPVHGTESAQVFRIFAKHFVEMCETIDALVSDVERLEQYIATYQTKEMYK